MSPKLNSILRLLFRNGEHAKFPPAAARFTQGYPSCTKFLGPCTKTFFLGMALSGVGK